MSEVSHEKKSNTIGCWQESFIPTYSDRIKKAKERLLLTPEICLERARAEMKAYEQYKNEPRIIQRARVLETYLREKTIFILEDELIVGNICSKYRGSQISGEIMAHFLDIELDDPVKDFSIRPYDKILIHSEERKELREKIIPAVKGGALSLFEYNLKHVDQDILEHTAPGVSACPHIPVIGDVSMTREAGHMFLNFEKALYKGLKGIKEEVKEKIRWENAAGMLDSGC